jgi:hypothetical protein
MKWPEHASMPLSQHSAFALLNVIKDTSKRFVCFWVTLKRARKKAEAEKRNCKNCDRNSSKAEGEVA